jgi:hypothetical protein
MIDYWGILVSSIISLAIGILVSRHFSSRKHLSWAVAKRKVLDPAGGNFPPDVQVFFDGVQVARLSEWTVGVWNSGNQPIVEKDLLGNEGLILRIPEHTIVKVTEPEATRAAIEPNAVNEDPERILIRFGLLDKNDALVFTVYTDEPGQRQTKERTTLEGDIVGIPGGPRRSMIPDRTSGIELLMILAGFSMIGLLSVFFGLSAFGLITDPRGSEIYIWTSENIGGDSLARNIEVGLGVLVAAVSAVLALITMFGLVMLILERVRRTPPLIVDEFSKLQQKRRAAYSPLALLR